MSEKTEEHPDAIAERDRVAAEKAVAAIMLREKQEREERAAREAAEAKAAAERAQAQANATADALDARIEALPKTFTDLFELLKTSSTKGRSEHGHLGYTASFVQHVEAIATEASAWIKRTL